MGGLKKKNTCLLCNKSPEIFLWTMTKDVASFKKSPCNEMMIFYFQNFKLILQLL